MLDNLAEDDETFAVTIASRGSSLTDNGVTIAVATGTIRGNDPLRVDLGGPRAVAVAAASASGVPYTLTLTGGTTDGGNDITVDYAYRVGAQSGTGTTTIAAGSLTGTFNVTPAGTPSVGETLVVTLTGVAAVRGTVTRGTSSVSRSNAAVSAARCSSPASRARLAVEVSAYAEVMSGSTALVECLRQIPCAIATCRSDSHSAVPEQHLGTIQFLETDSFTMDQDRATDGIRRSEASCKIRTPLELGGYV